MLKPKPLTAAIVSLWFIGLLAVVPFLVSRHRYPIPSFHNEWWAGLLGLLALLPLLWRDLWRDFSMPRSILLPLGLLLIVLLQLNLGLVNYPHQVLLFSLYLIWAALLMVLGATLRQQLSEEQLADTLSVFLLLGALLSALAGLIQHFHIPTPVNSLIMGKVAAEVYGNLAQHNHFANYSTLGLVGISWLWLRHPSARWWWVGASLLLLLVIGLSASRTAWLYTLAFAGMALVYHWRKAPEGNRLLGIMVFYLVGFVLLQFVGGWLSDLAGVSAYTIQDKILDRVGGESPRAQLWAVGQQIFWQHPWLGAGVGQFAWQHFLLGDSVGPRVETGVYFTNAHNMVLQLLAEQGVFAGLLLVLTALLWLWAFLRQQWTPARFWLLLLLTVEGIHSLLEYPMWYAFFLGLTAFWIGFGDTSRFRPRVTRISWGGLAAIILAGVAVLANLMYYYLPLEQLTAKRYHIAKYSPAQREDFLAGLRDIQENSVYAAQVDQIYSGLLQVESRDIDAKLRFMQSVEQFAPTNAAVYKQALLLALAGREQQARRQLQLAATSYPRDLPGVQQRLQQQALTDPALSGLAAYANELLMERKASVIHTK